MANNNLVLTIVLVAAALLLFNGGLSGNATYQQSCSKEGSSYCKGGDVWLCQNGMLFRQQTCPRGSDCVTTQVEGLTTSPQASFCLPRYSGSSMPENYYGWRTA